VESTTAFSFMWFSYLKTAFNCVAGQLIKNAMSFIFYILLSFLMLKSKEKKYDELKEILIIIILIHVASLLSYALFNNILDAVQLWSNIYIPLAAVFCFIILINLLDKGNRIQKVAAVTLIFLCYYQANIFYRFPIINQKYFNEVGQKYDGGTAVFYKSGADFVSFFSKNV
jgi:membrane-associated HD superfamily phosphohydrolase